MRFRPSGGHLALTSDEFRDIRKRHHPRAQPFAASSTATTSRQVRPLVWTRELLREFWEKLIKMRQRGRFGPISLALVSGDVSRSMRRDNNQVLLDRHQSAPSRQPDQRSDIRPVWPEMNDHLAVGCNLRYAMAVRCLLKQIQLEDEATFNTVARPREPAPRETRASSKSERARGGQESLSVAPKFAKPRKEEPFRGVRLCLLDTRGEVLLVV